MIKRLPRVYACASDWGSGDFSMIVHAGDTQTLHALIWSLTTDTDYRQTFVDHHKTKKNGFSKNQTAPESVVYSTKPN